MKNKQTLWIIISVVLLIIVVAAILCYIFLLQPQINSLQQQSELVREELADNYNELVVEYEGYKMVIRNDSLLAKLETEQMRVQRLEEELRTIKATNTKRINELKKELETLKVILKNYVEQMDSLNKINQQLTTENRQVTARFRQATETVSQLTKEKELLTETVQLASKLSASNINVRGLNDKNKAVNEIKKVAKIEFQFLISKNITATPGEKTIYIRIMKPDDDVLINRMSGFFVFEGKEINYSSKRNIEYEGEEYPMTIYWDIGETLLPGSYRVDIFADGNMIGKRTFKFDK